MKYYPKVKKFVKESFAKSGKFGDELRHFWRTAYWMKKLYPKADEAMLIAAVAHDLERAYRKVTPRGYIESKAGFIHRPTIMYHCRTGAKIVGDYLKEQGAPATMIRKVMMMIRGHEFGGNKWQNLLKDSDSISYFDGHYKKFLRKWIDVSSSDRVRKKFDWMYGRITSPQAKRFAKPMYKQSIKYLNKSYKTL
jgi:hypothetical protein